MAKLRSKAKRSDSRLLAIGIIVLVVAVLVVVVASVAPHLNQVAATASLVSDDSTPETNNGIEPANLTTEPQTTLRVVYTKS